MYHSDANADADDADNDADGNGNGYHPGSTTDNKESRSLLSKKMRNKSCTRKLILFDDATNSGKGEGGDMAFGGDASVHWVVMSGEWRQCNRQCGCRPWHLGGTRQCNGRCCWG